MLGINQQESSLNILAVLPYQRADQCGSCPFRSPAREGVPNMDVAWADLGEVFQQVYDLPAEERKACLDALCRDDDALRGEVESLLRAHDLAEHFTRAGRGDITVGPLASAFSSLQPSRQFGPYTLLRQLGQGGMGTVYLAARADDEFDQLVAIKTLKNLGPEGYERFRAERQVHANLEHPGIARLYGGGTSEHGVPYILMEYVDGGKPIDEYCDQAKLGALARLDLFRAVCDAVAFAHRNLVVHRDLKPSNILVKPGGDAKLLDFGISKQLPAGEEADFDPTADGPGPLTPAYASPEQLLGEAITTASDVFSLGVLLFKLLAGRSPFSRSLQERLQQLGADEGPPSLERCARLWADQPAAIAFASLDRGRRQDLAAIAAKALQRWPGERYGSVELLAADLKSCREGRPVVARRPTTTYRLSRWLRRNWLVAGITGVFMLFLLASAIALASQNSQVLRERDRVREEARKSERMLGLLLDMLEGSDPAKAQGADISVRDVLRTAEPRIDRELADQPKARAALLESLGKVFLNLGSLEDAERVLGRARELWQDTTWPDSPEGAATLDLLAAAARQRGAFPAALELLEEARALRVRAHGEGSAEEAASLGQIADIQLLTNRLDEAERNARRALEIFETEGDSTRNEAKIGTLFTLGELVYRKGGREPSLPTFERALAEARVTLGAEHPTTLALLGKLADLKAEHPADFVLAERYIREKIAALGRLHDGRDHADMAVSLDALAGILGRRKKLDEARQAFEESIRMRRRLMGEKSPFLAVTLGNFGWFHLFRRGDPFTAEPILRQALAMAEEFFPPQATLLTYPLIGIGRCRVLAGDPAGGEPFLRRALEIRRAAKTPSAAEIARVEIFLGESLAAQGRCLEAAPLLENARAVLEPRGAPDDLERMKEPWRTWETKCQADRNPAGPIRPSEQLRPPAPR